MSLSVEPAAGNIGACEPSREQRLRRAIKAPGPIETVVESVRAILAAELDARLAAVAAEDDGGYEDDMIVTSSPAEHLRAEHAHLVSALQAAIVPPWPVRPAYAGDLPEWQRLRLIEALGLLRRRGGRRLHVLGYTLGGYEFWRRLPRLDGAAVTTCGEKVKVDGEQVRVVRLPEWVRQREAREKRTRKRQQTASNRCSEHERAKQCVALPAQPMAERSGDRQAGGTGVRGASSAQHEGAETGAGERVDQSPAASSDASSELRPLMFATADTDACEPEYEVSDEVEVTLPVRLLAHRDEIGDHGLYVLHLLHRNRRASDEDTEGRAQELRDGWRPLSTKILERILGTVRVDGQPRQRTGILLGSRKEPGLLERLGLIERRSGYLAGVTCQRYRLRDRDRTGPTERVMLSMRRRAVQSMGPDVPPWLVESYSKLVLDYHGALYELCRRAGVPETPYADQVSASIAALPAPPVVMTKSGKRAARQPADPRARWQAELAALRAWDDPRAAAMSSMHRPASTHRLETTLGGLPGWARAYLRLGLERSPISLIDIRAAQLATLAARMRRDGVDAPAWYALLEGDEDPYRALYRIAYGAELEDRDVWKRDLCSSLLYGSVAALRKSAIGRAIAEHHPAAYAWLERKKDEQGASEFACETMRLEASIVIDTLAPRLGEAGIVVATIHDCILVRRRDAARAEQMFAAVLREAGVCAVLKREDVG